MFFRRLITATSMLCALAVPASASVFGISIAFDDYPTDISWTVEDLFGVEFGSGGGYSNALSGTTVTSLIDLSMGNYVFALVDSYGDGLCCSEGIGGYTLSLDDTVFYTSNGTFGSGDTVNFTVAAVSAVPLPAGGLLLLSGLVGFARLQHRKTPVL